MGGYKASPILEKIVGPMFYTIMAN
uniref:Uncharacterized protein n=1 Tax=Arundo donax TaxID=35708 RepID=A0A0A9CE46_ARUDO